MRFDALVEYLEGFDAAALERIGDLYDVPGADPLGIALTWCERPEGVARVVEMRARSASARGLLADLALNHDEPLELRWRDRRAARTLQSIGLARAEPGPARRETCTMPGALAAIVAPLLSERDVRPTLVLTCSRWESERLEALAGVHGIEAHGRVPLVLALCERFSTPEVLDTMLSSVPDPEWIGTALMALELGGMCYWQDLFGPEQENAPPEEGSAQVIPLMRRQDLQEERDMAHVLQEIGLLIRLPGPDASQPLAAVPEELWLSLWELGRDWLTDWAAAAWEGLGDGGLTRRDAGPGDDAMGRRLKWLACEIDAQRVRPGEDARLDAFTLERCASISGLASTEIEGAVEMGAELGLWSYTDEGTWRVDSGALGALDVSRVEFARSVLGRWCVGELGARADLAASRAFGVDERWRDQVVSLLARRSEWFPAWLESPGIDSMFTGAGYLRPLDRSNEEVLRDELAYVASYSISAKLLWLDMLGLLEPGRWYAESSLRELLQLVCAAVLFQLMSAVLEQSNPGLFLPVQRASFLTDPQHTAAFDEWIADWIDELAGPLGVAARGEDDRVWLDTKAFKVESPRGITDNLRLEQIRLVLQNDALELDLPRRAGNGWRPRLAAPAAVDDARISLEEDAATILERVRDQSIARYDGKFLVLGDS